MHLEVSHSINEKGDNLIISHNIDDNFRKQCLNPYENLYDELIIEKTKKMIIVEQLKTSFI